MVGLSFHTRYCIVSALICRFVLKGGDKPGTLGSEDSAGPLPRCLRLSGYIETSSVTNTACFGITYSDNEEIKTLIIDVQPINLTL